MKKSYKGRLKLNHNLCQYLSLRLPFAIQAAHQCKYRIASGPRGFMEWCRGSLKALLRLARESESFIRACCSDQWIRHAIMFTNVLEYVSLLGYELNTCRGALLDETCTCFDVENTLKRSNGKGADVETVKLRFNSDQSRLLENLEAPVHSSNPSTQECQLATFLFGRWTGMGILDSIGSSSASIWEVDYESLEQLEKLGGGSAGFVYKTLWLGVECAEKTFFGSNHPIFRNEVSTSNKYPFKSDIYSFAMVCYEILIGEVPFQTISSHNEVRSIVLNGQRPNLPDQCLPSLKTLVQECWNSDARARPGFGEISEKWRYLKFLLMLGFL